MLLERVGNRLQRQYLATVAGLLLWQARRSLRKEPLDRLLGKRPLYQVSGQPQLLKLREQLFALLKQDANPCLPRALILFHQLRGLGKAPSLVMAVPRSGLPRSGNLSAHAWVELDGLPYAEAQGFLPQQWLEVFRHPPSPQTGSSSQSRGE